MQKRQVIWKRAGKTNTHIQRLSVFAEQARFQVQWLLGQPITRQTDWLLHNRLVPCVTSDWTLSDSSYLHIISLR